MNTEPKHSDGIREEGSQRRIRRPAFVLALAILLLAEAALLFGLLAWMTLELVTTRATSEFGGIALIILTAVAAVWVLAIGIGTLRMHSWIRGAAVTWQIVQIAVAAGCFEGLYAQPALGWALVVPSVVAILLVVSPSVTAVTRRNVARPD